MPDLFTQTSPPGGYPAEASAFADALEAIMADGTHDLAGIVAELNARGITAGGQTTWTDPTLSAYFAALAGAGE